MVNLNKSVNSFIHFLDYTYPLSKNILESIINVRNIVTKPHHNRGKGIKSISIYGHLENNKRNIIELLFNVGY